VISRIPDRNIWLVDGVIFLLGVGYGVALSILAIFLDARGFDEQLIGALAAWFARGIACLAIPVGYLIRRWSAKATLVVSLAGYAAAVAAFPFLPGYPAMAACRFLDGACSVGVWVSCETILLTRADGRNKAFVTSLYAIAMALGYVVGPFIAKLVVAFAPMRWAFVVSGVSAATASLLTWARLDRDVRGHDDAHEPGEPAAGPAASSLEVFRRIKTSCFGTFAYGYFQASVVLFLPLYLIEDKHVPAERTIFVTAFFAGGMLVMSTWAGRLGDRHGHLLVMRVLATIGAVMVASFVLLPSFPSMCAAVFVAGATLASISPVSLALQGVVTPRAELGRANAFYNAAYAVGMLVGPPVSSVLFTRWGGAAMLFHLAALWAVFVGLTLAFATDDPRHATSVRAQRAMLR